MERGIERENVFLRIFQVLLVVLLSATVVLALIQVFSRYVIEKNAKGVEELARLSIVWLSFLGASYAYLFDDLITVDMLKEHVKSKRLLNGIGYFIRICVLAVSLIMIINGLKYVDRYWVYPDLSTSLLFPRSLFFLPIPISGLILFITSIFKLFTPKVKDGNE